MLYEVHYLIGGEEHSDQVEASDAAEAAAAIRDKHGTTPESFELLSLNLVEELPNPAVEASGVGATSVD